MSLVEIVLIGAFFFLAITNLFLMLSVKKQITVREIPARDDSRQNEILKLLEDLKNPASADKASDNGEFVKWTAYLQNSLANDQLGNAIFSIDLVSSRYPGEPIIFNKIMTFFASQLEVLSGSSRIDLLKMCEQILVKFQLNCKIEDLAHLKAAEQLLLLYRQKEMDSLTKRKISDIESGLAKIEAKLSTFSLDAGLITEESIKQIVELDQSLDKNFLSMPINESRNVKYKDLVTAFNTVVTSFKETKLKEEKEKIRKYNQEALKAAKNAYDMLELVESDPEKAINPVAEKLGGWDDRLLYPSVALYKSSVYGEIFQKFEPEDKKKFTARVLNYAKEKFVA